MGDEDAVGELVAAVFAREGCDLVLSACKEGGDDVSSNGASGLIWGCMLAIFVHCGHKVWMGSNTPTMATLSMAFLKPDGWSLAYLGILGILVDEMSSWSGCLSGLCWCVPVCMCMRV